MAPDDPQCDEYFITRRKNRLQILFGSSKSLIKMCEWQGYLSAVCGNPLFDTMTDENSSLHVHHLIPKRKGGKICTII